MRTWLKVLVPTALVLVVGGYVGVRYYLHARQMPIGVPCAMTAGVDDNESETYEGCNGGLCIRETNGESYCSQECKTDDDCPAIYVCEPTRSRRRRACMEEGADLTPADAGPDAAHALRRKRQGQ
jgi:hypothetical protein